MLCVPLGDFPALPRSQLAQPLGSGGLESAEGDSGGCEEINVLFCPLTSVKGSGIDGVGKGPYEFFFLPEAFWTGRVK